MSEQFSNAMSLAMDAYKAGNEDEAKSFCNQALMVNAKSGAAKALKGASVLISFSLAGAEGDAVEAFEIWKSISDITDLTDEYKNIIVDSAFSFRSSWLAAAENHYKEFKDVDGTEDEFKHVKKCYELFMENVATLKIIEDQMTDRTIEMLENGVDGVEFTYLNELVAGAEDRNLKKFMNFAYKGLKAYNDKEANAPSFYIVNFAGSMIDKNISRTDEIGLKAKELSEMFDSAKKAHTKKLLTYIGIGVGVFIILAIIGSFME